MDVPDRARREARARSFGPGAGVYESARPGYPAAAVRDLLGPGPLDVLDLGAGTGKLTRTVAAEGHRVVAVDPSAEMLAELRRAVPGVETRVGPAESLPADAGAFDAVVAGQAYHWFDPAVALPEIARVLRPGGTIGLLWNSRDETVPWIARFGELVGSEDASSALEPPVLQPMFGPASVRWYDNMQEMSVERLVDLGHSRSSLLVMSPADREARLAEIRALGESVGEPVEMRYRLQVWSATRA